DFSMIPAEQIAIAFNILGPVLTPLTDTVVDGFSLNVGSNGEWHKHLEYTLTAPAADGAYLLELELFHSPPDLGDKLPFWLVFGQNADAQTLQEASQWVTDHLVSPACPADWNQSGAVNSQDFFDFLDAFFASDADFNHDNATNSQDLFDFLTAFFAGC